MSEKYIVIAVGVFLFVMGIGMTVDVYTKNTCKIEAIKAGMKGDEVGKACK